jgi:hypothetical protein
MALLSREKRVFWINFRDNKETEDWKTQNIAST